MGESSAEIDHSKLKRGEAYADVDGVHDGEMDMWKRFGPTLLVAFNMVPECLHNCLVGPLTAAVGLRVVCHGHLQ